jgi:hypothetical protein
MYLVAYLVIIYSMSVKAAMTLIDNLLDEYRDLKLDRHKSLVPIITHIYENDWVNYRE